MGTDIEGMVQIFKDDEWCEVSVGHSAEGNFFYNRDYFAFAILNGTRSGFRGDEVFEPIVKQLSHYEIPPDLSEFFRVLHNCSVVILEQLLRWPHWSRFIVRKGFVSLTTFKADYENVPFLDRKQPDFFWGGGSENSSDVEIMWPAYFKDSIVRTQLIPQLMKICVDHKVAVDHVRLAFGFY